MNYYNTFNFFLVAIKSVSLDGTVSFSCNEQMLLPSHSTKLFSINSRHRKDTVVKLDPLFSAEFF
jgi:hypothetical protein